MSLSLSLRRLSIDVCGYQPSSRHRQGCRGEVARQACLVVVYRRRRVMHYGCMSEFWAGVAAGLIGAIIGGGCTLWGARLQSRATLAAARAEIEAVVKHQQESRLFDLRREALVKTLEAVALAERSISEMVRAHTHNNAELVPNCTTADIPTLVTEGARAINRCYWTYSEDFIGETAGRALDTFTSCMDDLLREGADLSRYYPQMRGSGAKAHEKDVAGMCSLALAGYFNLGTAATTAWVELDKSLTGLNKR